VPVGKTRPTFALLAIDFFDRLGSFIVRLVSIANIGIVVRLIPQANVGSSVVPFCIPSTGPLFRSFLRRARP